MIITAFGAKVLINLVSGPSGICMPGDLNVPFGVGNASGLHEVNKIGVFRHVILDMPT